METLIKILEKLGESFVRVGWMFGLRVYWQAPSPSPPRKDDR
jgi:hypothetical protein